MLRSSWKSRVVLASYTDICIGVKFLSPQVRRRARKRTQSEIRLAALELGCDLPRTERNGTNPDTRSRNGHPRDQWRQETHHADIAQQQTNHALGRRRVEGLRI